MKKIVQIATANAGTLFALTEDGDVYQGHYKGPNVTWIKFTVLQQKPPQERTKPPAKEEGTPDKDVSLQPPTKPQQNGHQQGKNK